jgi:PKD repeat protein
MLPSVVLQIGRKNYTFGNLKYDFMKKLLFLVGLLNLCSFGVSAQNPDTLFYENFESGGLSFQLNTPDLGSASGTAGVNQWIVNNAYAGGSGQIVCLGFPFTFTIPATQPQPQVITGGANTSYMHIMSDPGQASGILNSNYAAADGICTLDETNFARMSADVNTTAYDSVTVSFLWHCAGGTSIYGELYYSTNQGAAWNLITSPVAQYKNQSSWTVQNISSALLAGHTTLRFGFRFVNQNSGTASDPGFGIDEFMVTGKVASPPPVAAFAVSDSVICAGDCVSFTDLSSGNPSSWFWVFQGAATGFSTVQNPGPICFNNPGTYDVTLIVNSSSGTDTLTVTTVTVNPNPNPPNITFSGDTLFATPGFTSYQWFLNDTVISGAGGSSYLTTVNGSYSVAVVDSNGCSAESDTLNFSTGLYSVSGSVLFEVYPNPVYDRINIVSPQAVISADLFDMQGRKVISMQANRESNISMDVKSLSAGVYFLEVNTERSKGVAKVLIQ